MNKLFILFFTLLLSVCAHAQVPSYISTTGLLGWYPFNGNAHNDFNTGKNGSVIGPVLTTDRFGSTGSAYHFNGMLDHIVVDTTFFNVGWSDYTISYWINSDSLNNPFNANNDQCSFNTIPHNGIDLTYNWVHSNKYSIYTNSNPAVVGWNILPGAHSRANVSAHVWNHIVVRKQDDTLYTFYLNGVLDSTYHKPLVAVNYYCKVLFGNIDSSFGNEGFWGKLDDYALWNRGLSACEVKKLFHSSEHLFITMHPINDTAAVGTPASFSITDTGTGNTYQWQVNTGSGYTDLTGTTPYAGISTPTLTITAVSGSMSNYVYRCVVTGSGGCVDTSTGGKLLVPSLGVTEQSRSTTISVSPNPTTGTIRIAGAGKVNAEIYNSMGQLMKKVSNTEELSIKDLAAGIYLLKLYDKYGAHVFTQELIKQ